MEQRDPQPHIQKPKNRHQRRAEAKATKKRSRDLNKLLKDVVPTLGLTMKQGQAWARILGAAVAQAGGKVVLTPLELGQAPDIGLAHENGALTLATGDPEREGEPLNPQVLLDILGANRSGR